MPFSRRAKRGPMGDEASAAAWAEVFGFNVLKPKGREGKTYGCIELVE